MNEPPAKPGLDLQIKINGLIIALGLMIEKTIEQGKSVSIHGQILTGYGARLRLQYGTSRAVSGGIDIIRIIIFQLY